MDRQKIAQKIQDLERISENRHIIRGSHTQETEKSGQEKNTFISSETTANLFSSLGLSYSCKKGLKSSTQNQDDFSIIFENNTLLISVFDGHGVNGAEISHYLHILLPNLLLSHPKFPESIPDIFSDIFQQCNSQLLSFCTEHNINSDYSGSTCTLIVLKDSTLHVANIGDSRAIYQSTSGEVLRLSAEHKPGLISEMERIRVSGGEIRMVTRESCPRIFVKGQNLPGISISRSFGDFIAQSIGVSAEPYVFTKNLESSDKYLVLGSDGVWEFISDQQAVDIILESSKPATTLAETAWNKWIENEVDAVDDITAIVIDLQEFNKYLKSIKA